MFLDSFSDSTCVMLNADQIPLSLGTNCHYFWEQLPFPSSSLKHKSEKPRHAEVYSEMARYKDIV